MILISLLSSFALFSSSVTRADAIDDRIAYARQESMQRGIESSKSSSYATNLRRIQGFQRFIAEHGGLAEDGNCRVSIRNFVEENRPYEERYGDYNYRSLSGRSETIAFSSLNAAGEYSLISCRLNLRDGLACELDLTGESGTQGPRREAQCYDAVGTYRGVMFNYLGGGRSTGSTKTHANTKSKIKRKR